MRGSSSAAGGKQIVLPQFPRFEDGALRSRWAKEYDRVESELLKTHLSVSIDESSKNNNDRHQHGKKHHQHQQQNSNDGTELGEGEGRTTVISVRHLDTEWSREPPTEEPKDPVKRMVKKKGGYHGPSNAARRAADSSSAAAARYGGAGEDEISPYRPRSQASSSGYEGVATSISRGAAVGSLEDNSNSLGRKRSSGGGGGATAAAGGGGGGGVPHQWDINRWARVLDAVVHPPIQFRASLNVLGSEGWDLHWCSSIGRTDRVPTLQTLETLRESVYEGPKDIALNSPRSILIMLKNGLAVTDLRPRTRDSFFHNDLPAKEQTIAHQHYEQRRKAVISSLKQEYRQMCQHVTLHNLIDAMVSIRDARQYKLSHPEHPPAALQPWTVATHHASPRSRSGSPDRGNNNNNNNSPVRAATATPTMMGGGGRGNNNEDEDGEGGNQFLNRRGAATPGPGGGQKGDASLRGFDLEAQFRRQELQKQKESEALAKRQAQEDHARIVAARRLATMEKIKEVSEETKRKADERQRILEEHVAAVEANRIKMRKLAQEREKRKTQHRKVIFEQAQQKQKERRQQILTKIAREEESIVRSRSEKTSQLKIENAMKHQQNSDRAFLGLRHKRAAEFKKLFTVADIYDKADRAEHASQQRRWGLSQHSSNSGGGGGIGGDHYYSSSSSSQRFDY